MGCSQLGQVARDGGSLEKYCHRTGAQDGRFTKEVAEEMWRRSGREWCSDFKIPSEEESIDLNGEGEQNNCKFSFKWLGEVSLHLEWNGSLVLILTDASNWERQQKTRSKTWLRGNSYELVFLIPEYCHTSHSSGCQISILDNQNR